MTTTGGMCRVTADLNLNVPLENLLLVITVNIYLDQQQ